MEPWVMIGKVIKHLVITCNSSLYGSKDYNRHHDLVSFKSQQWHSLCNYEWHNSQCQKFGESRWEEEPWVMISKPISGWKYYKKTAAAFVNFYTVLHWM